MLVEFMQGRKDTRNLEFVRVSCVYSTTKLTKNAPLIGYRLECCPEQVLSSEEEVIMWLQLNYAGQKDFGGLVLDMDDVQANKFIEAWKTISGSFGTIT